MHNPILFDLWHMWVIKYNSILICTMPEKLISDVLISDSETKRVTIRILVTRVNETRHWLVVAHALGTRRVTNNNISVTLAKKTRHW
jgi:hypothetical protein